VHFVQAGVRIDILSMPVDQALARIFGYLPGIEWPLQFPFQGSPDTISS
jgi:hypothetical protein